MNTGERESRNNPYTIDDQRKRTLLSVCLIFLISAKYAFDLRDLQKKNVVLADFLLSYHRNTPSKQDNQRKERCLRIFSFFFSQPLPVRHHNISQVFASLNSSLLPLGVFCFHESALDSAVDIKGERQGISLLSSPCLHPRVRDKPEVMDIDTKIKAYRFVAYSAVVFSVTNLILLY